uniref:Uncharacterized protein n=1 Tax=Arundo donax TaxID=35708 RepID=A0A0A9FVA8_ARUDO
MSKMQLLLTSGQSASLSILDHPLLQSPRNTDFLLCSIQLQYLGYWG